METVENQKIIIIDKTKTGKDNFALLDGTVVEHALTALKGNVFKIWMYLARWGTSKKFALSSAHCCDMCNISRPTYNAAIKELIEKGYLVRKSSDSNIYIFHDYGRESGADSETLQIEYEKKNFTF